MSALPDPIRTLTGKIRKIEEQLRRLSNASAFTNTGWTIIDPGQVVQDGSMTIPDNGLLLVDGGDVVMLDEAPSSTELFRLGMQMFGDRGLTISRQDGSVFFQIRKPFAPTDPAQVALFRDRSNRIIGGDSVLSTTGFDSPHMSMPFIPVDPTSLVRRGHDLGHHVHRHPRAPRVPTEPGAEATVQGAMLRRHHCG